MSVLSCNLNLTVDSRLNNYPAIQGRIAQTNELLYVAEWKKGLDSDFPIMICILGGTGGGKSVLFNSLVSEKLSKVGVRRPCTRGAVVLCPSRATDSLGNLKRESGFLDELEIIPRDKDELKNVIMVDTPDFDSVEKSNRITSNRFFMLSDFILFVASQEKYADLLGRNLIRRSVEWGKEIIVILNKAESETAFLDFGRSLANELPALELIRIDRTARPPEILTNSPAIDQLSGLFQRFQAVEEVRKLRVSECERLKSNTLNSVETTAELLQELRDRIQIIVEHIDAALNESLEEMETKLDVSASREVEEKIQARLENLLRKYDILYTPRAALRNAVQKIVATIGGTILSDWFGQNRTVLNETISLKSLEQNDYANSLTQLEASVAKFNLEVAELLSSEEDFSDFRRIASESCPRFSSEQIRAFYEEAFPEIEKLLEAEFERFKEGLSTVDEIKLYGSYTLWALFLVTAEVAIGGGLTLLDMVLNSVIVPFIPKWLLKFKIIDILRDIAERVDRQRREALRGILMRQAEIYIQVFSDLAPKQESIGQLLKLRSGLQSIG